MTDFFRCPGEIWKSRAGQSKSRKWKFGKSKNWQPKFVWGCETVSHSVRCSILTSVLLYFASFATWNNLQYGHVSFDWLLLVLLGNEPERSLRNFAWHSPLGLILWSQSAQLTVRLSADFGRRIYKSTTSARLNMFLAREWPVMMIPAFNSD